MAAEVTVRLADPGDVEGLVALNQFVQRLHFDARPDIFHDPEAMPGIEGHFQRLCEAEPNDLLIAEVAGHAIGYVQVELQRLPANPFTHAIERIYVHQISVHPSWRRKGVGRALMSRVLRDARDRGVHLVALDTWTWNGASQQFFEEVGFSGYCLRMEGAASSL